MTDLKLLQETAYFAEITQVVEDCKPGAKIALASMSFEPEEAAIAYLMDALQAAAKRGVSVNLLIDAHAFMVDRNDVANGPLRKTGTINTSDDPAFQVKYTLLEAMRKAGVRYAITNKPVSKLALPVAGRSHIKTFVANDLLYIGGCNLGHVEQQDWMVRIKNAGAATWLYDIIVQAMHVESVRRSLDGTDRDRRIDSNNILLLDAGMRNQSLILKSALEVIDQAQEHLVITCQFFPNGVTARHLADAVHRGVKVEVYYNHPSKQAGKNILIQQLVLAAERLRGPGILFAHQLPASRTRLHAKIIASEKAAMIGSHNYVSLGVTLGTAEIALRSHDVGLATELTRAVRARLGA